METLLGKELLFFLTPFFFNLENKILEKGSLTQIKWGFCTSALKLIELNMTFTLFFVTSRLNCIFLVCSITVCD